MQRHTLVERGFHLIAEGDVEIGVEDLGVVTGNEFRRFHMQCIVGGAGKRENEEGETAQKNGQDISFFAAMHSKSRHVLHKDATALAAGL